MKKVFLVSLFALISAEGLFATDAISALIEKLESNPNLCINGEEIQGEVVIIDGLKPPSLAIDKKSPIIFSDKSEINSTSGGLSTIIGKLDENNQSEAEAKLNLAIAYYRGIGVDKDQEKAMTLLKEAVKLGSVKAAYEYGMMLFDKGEYDESFSLIYKAAQGGDMRAQFHLGVMYWNGHGTPVSDSEGYKWMKASADQGFAEAQSRVSISLLKMWAENENNNPYRMLAISYLLRAASQGHARAIHNLASDQRGRGNHNVAKRLFAQAAKRGNQKSLEVLQKLYGESVN